MSKSNCLGLAHFTVAGTTLGLTSKNFRCQISEIWLKKICGALVRIMKNALRLGNFKHQNCSVSQTLYTLFSYHYH